jgi:hypothetical protein
VPSQPDRGVGDGERGSQWTWANAASTPFNCDIIQLT